MKATDVFVAVVISVLVTLLLLAIYKFVINPQMVIPPGKGGPCPELWLLNPGSGMCEPQYTTKCTPFDPNTPTLKTSESKCNLAHMCGTDWAAHCP